MVGWIQTWLGNQGFDPLLAEGVGIVAAVSLVLMVGTVVNFVVKGPVLRALTRLLQSTQFRWCDAILQRRVLHRCVYLAPVWVIHRMVPLTLAEYERAADIITGSMAILLLFVGLLVMDALLDAVVDIYQTRPSAREIPIKGFVQALKVVFYFIGGIFIISILVDQTPLYLLSGLGAVTAILLFVFKDPILGFVAGIQLTANSMISRGDWIEMPKYGANGNVLEIALTTVKVQNFDQTITTIPTYALITDSFKNWRGMTESEGRRIKRSIYIDVNTIRFCTEEMLARFTQIHFIAAYIEEKKREVAGHNQMNLVDTASLVNGRQLTNVGTFRAYVEAYLRNHPMINKEMICMVRQKDPGPNGLPLEIYAFSRDQVWVNYEAIQADLFDHILAVVQEFDLQLHQNPSGRDFAHLLERE
jgi:miniconductance mechanosensitive channel